MKDVLKLCGRCRHEHKYGILRYSLDNTPLYGPRRCESCDCDQFVEYQEGMENLPALTQSETEDLWAQTSFLNAQVPMATRIAVRQIMQLGEGKGTPGSLGKFFGKGDGKTPMERQWPEFMGLMISQLTDVRGAMVRDESKFAHLIAHTDDVVESMRGVNHLNDRLMNLHQSNEQTNERIDRLETLLSAIAEKMGVEVAAPVHPDGEMEPAAAPMPLPNGSLKDEAIITDAEPVES